MENLNEGHNGIEKTLQRALTAIFWPDLTNDVKVKISSCPTCIAHQPSQPKETLKSHEILSRLWQILATDLFTWNNKQYLVLVDCCFGQGASRWVWHCHWRSEANWLCILSTIDSSLILFSYHCYFFTVMRPICVN